MKIVYLMRHAKAEEGADKTDAARALTNRGLRAAALMGLYFAQEKIVPDLILSSPALRTVQTMEQMIAATGWQCPTEKVKGLYMADEAFYRQLLLAQSDSCKKLLIIGHNPALQIFASSLCSEQEGEDVNRLYRGFATGAVAAIALNIRHWHDLDAKKIQPQLQFFIEPSDLV